jgi:hypothetical protein
MFNFSLEAPTMSQTDNILAAIETLESSNYVFPKISTSNSKLSADNIASFSLPAIIACPGAGACKKICYASCGTYRFPGTIDVMARNFIASKRDYFVMSMIMAISALPKKITILRVHDAGDFYSTEYAKKWDAIAREVNTFRPMKFYSYTKTFACSDISLAALEANPHFSLIQSFGSKNDSLIDVSKPHARVFKSALELSSAGYTNCSDSDLLPATGCQKIGFVAHGELSKNI